MNALLTGLLLMFAAGQVTAEVSVDAFKKSVVLHGFYWHIYKVWCKSGYKPVIFTSYGGAQLLRRVILNMPLNRKLKYDRIHFENYNGLPAGFCVRQLVAGQTQES